MSICRWELQPDPPILVASDQDPHGKDTAESGDERVNTCTALLADLFPSKKCCERQELPRT